jgi:putative MATE family efflux protein
LAGNDLTTAPIPGLIRRLAVPVSIGFFFNTMYNVVDTYFAGQLNTAALAALSYSFPVFFVLIAMGSGFSTGATALIGQALGRGDRREAALVGAQGIILGALLTAVIMTAGYLAAPSLFGLLGAEGASLDYALEYIGVILGGTAFVLTFYMFNGILNATGDTRPFRDYLIVATMVNIGLDPWFMYGGLGVPAMGVGGIALATVAAQAGGVFYLGWRARQTGLLFRSEGARWRPHLPTLRAIAGQGIPASLNMMSVALGIFIITRFLSEFSEATVAAYGAATRIEQIVLLPAIGLNVAALTLSAQNGGAGRFDRVRTAIRTALGYGAVIMALGTAFVFFGSRWLMGVFTDDREVVDIGAHYLRIAAFIQYAYVILFVNTSALQGLKLPSFALWIGLFRQIVAPITLFWLVTRVWQVGLDGIWWSIFGITWLAAAVAVVFAQQRVGRLEAQYQEQSKTDPPPSSSAVPSADVG